MKFRFAQNISVTDINTIPEDSRPFYTEKDGAYVINPEFQTQTEMIDGLRTANEKIRKEHRAATGQSQSVHEAITDRGFDSLDAVFEQIDDLQTQVDSGNKTGKEDFEKRLKDTKNAHEQKLSAVEKAHNEALTGLDGEINTLLIDGAGQRALAKHKVKSSNHAKLLMHEIRAKSRTVKNDEGQREVRIMDSTGDPRFNGSGGYLDIDGLVSDMRSSNDYGDFFEGEGKRGGGTAPNQHGSPQSRPNMGGKDDRSSTQKIKSGLEQLSGNR